MEIKIRPFRTVVGDVKVEVIVERHVLFCRFFDLVSFGFPVSTFGEDHKGAFGVVDQVKSSDEDGFTCGIEPDVDEGLEGICGAHIYCRFIEPHDLEIAHQALKQQGYEPSDVNLLIPPRLTISVYCDLDGSLESGHLNRVSGSEISGLVRAAASKRVLFLPHAVSQMLRPDRMITTAEVAQIVKEGEVIEDYLEDVRGHSCLILGFGEGHRPIHIVCSPKADFLAIITAYLPDENEWSADYRTRATE